MRSRRTSEHFVTLTLGGPEMADFHPMGYDQCVRLFFRREGQGGLRLPTASGNRWMAQCLMMNAATRPWVRNYTVRAFRPGALEIDIDFVVHGTGSPASEFAVRAAPARRSDSSTRA
ncbi:siderophore-interacting protein [Streptomyces sp. M19]